MRNLTFFFTLFLGLLYTPLSWGLAQREHNLSPNCDQYPNWSVSLVISNYTPGQHADTICVSDARPQGNSSYGGTRITLRPSSTTYSFARDKMAAGNVIANLPRQTIQYLVSEKYKNPLGLGLGGTMTITLPVLGTHNGQTVYKLDDEGYLGLKVWFSILGGQATKIRNETTYAVNNGYSNKEQDYVRVLTSEATATAINFNIDSQIIIFNPDGIKNNRITFPSKPIGTLNLQSSTAKLLKGWIDLDLSIRGITVTLQSRSCSYTGDKEQTVAMNKIGVSHFTNRNEVYGGTTELTLTCPANSNVTPYITYTDNHNINNNTQVLSLAQGSTAQNVGIKVYMNDSSTPVTFGPLAFNHGTENTSGQAITQQTYMEKVGNANKTGRAQTHKVKLVAKYARTNTHPIVPGNVNGEMLFTFSYY